MNTPKLDSSKVIYDSIRIKLIDLLYWKTVDSVKESWLYNEAVIKHEHRHIFQHDVVDATESATRNILSGASRK